MRSRRSRSLGTNAPRPEVGEAVLDSGTFATQQAVRFLLHLGVPAVPGGPATGDDHQVILGLAVQAEEAEARRRCHWRYRKAAGHSGERPARTTPPGPRMPCARECSAGCALVVSDRRRGRVSASTPAAGPGSQTAGRVREDPAGLHEADVGALADDETAESPGDVCPSDLDRAEQRMTDSPACSQCSAPRSRIGAADSFEEVVKPNSSRTTCCSNYAPYTHRWKANAVRRVISPWQKISRKPRRPSSPPSARERRASRGLEHA